MGWFLCPIYKYICIMKKLLSLLILSILFIIATPIVSAYDDISNNSPNFYAIEYLRRNDVFPETKNFNPDIIITKAEFIKYLVLLNNPDFKIDRNINLPFEDTSNTSWYAPYFKNAIALGILSDRDIKAEPYKKLSVIDAITLLFHSQSIPIPNVYRGYIPYKDVERNKKFAPLIMRSLEFGLIEAESFDHVGIYRRINRAEAASMIYRMDLVNLTPVKGTLNKTSFEQPLQKIIDSWDLILSEYIDRDELDKTVLSDTAISAMAESLNDPYSAYLDEEKNLAFSDDLDGEIEGIGAYIGVNDDDKVAIIAPMLDSPAETAGILSGDIIKKIDDVEVSELSLYEIVNLIKGPKGTSVKLTIERSGLLKDIIVIRDVIQITSLQYKVIENGTIMYINLSQFNQNAIIEFKEVVEIIEANSEIKGLIIDVRDNPGGLLSSALGILDFLLEPGSEAVTIQYNTLNHTQYAKGEGELLDFPTVIMINKGSASASEILAGTMQDFGLAKIIGEKSFGKGTVQTVNNFPDKSSLKITIAKWLTPLRQDIQANGVIPDIKVSNIIGTTSDEQLLRAIKEVKKLK